ncbi:MAG TPA: hypothetical protein VD969_15840 [Symbiobacteriaceae bacterium]|nr:hypothetical protein [Symbiobacteriaceae bacterium]
MRNIVALLTIVALLAAGCASRSSGKQFRQLTYSYTGGIAGFNQSLVVTADGSFQMADRGKPGRAGRLPAAETRALRQLVDGVSWSTVDEQYVDPRVADAIFEGVTVQIGKSTYQTVVGTGGLPPAELARLLGKLKQILDMQK